MLQQGEVESHGVQYAILSSRTEDKSGWETDVTAEQSAGGRATAAAAAVSILPWLRL